MIIHRLLFALGFLLSSRCFLLPPKASELEAGPCVVGDVVQVLHGCWAQDVHLSLSFPDIFLFGWCLIGCFLFGCFLFGCFLFGCFLIGWFLIGWFLIVWFLLGRLRAG